MLGDFRRVIGARFPPLISKSRFYPNLEPEGNINFLIADYICGRFMEKKGFWISGSCKIWP